MALPTESQTIEWLSLSGFAERDSLEDEIQHIEVWEGGLRQDCWTFSAGSGPTTKLTNSCSWRTVFHVCSQLNRKPCGN